MPPWSINIILSCSRGSSALNRGVRIFGTTTSTYSVFPLSDYYIWRHTKGLEPLKINSTIKCGLTVVRFFRKFGSRVVAGAGIWVALGCLNFFWPALTVILFAIAAYYLLTTTRFVEFWLLLAGWFAFAQLCGVLVGIWSLFYPPRTSDAG